MKRIIGLLIILSVLMVLVSCGKKTFTITWKNQDGEVLEVDENVEVDTLPTFDSNLPTKIADNKYSYTFSGWSPEVVKVKGDATYVAEFSKTPIDYSITFKVDGEVIKTILFNADTKNITPPNIPLKEGHTGAWGTYNLDLPQNQEVLAIYTVNKYTVTFKDHKGVVKEESLDFGSPIVIPSEIPASYTDLETGKNKVFLDWGQVDDTVPSHDVVYQARYKNEDECHVVFRTHDNKVFKELFVNKNEKIVAPTENPVKEGYTFDLWLNGDVEYNFNLGVTTDLNLTPKFNLNTYKIIFKANDEVVAVVVFDLETESITEPAIPPKEGHSAQWGTYDLKLGQDQEVLAAYTLNQYTVTWKNHNGQVLEVDENVLYGDMPEYNGDEPTKEGEFIFNGWSPSVSVCKGDIEYTAVFKSTLAQTDDFVFADLGEGYAVINYIGNSTDVEVPSTYLDKPVTSIEQWAFYGNKTLKSVVIPDSVLYIRYDAFNSCSQLTTVTLGSNVKLIEMDAFADCLSLTTINLPEGLIEIGDRVFLGCSSLTSLSLPNSLESFGSNMFMAAEAFVLTEYENAHYLGNQTNPYLVFVEMIDQTKTSIKIHDNCKIIGDESLAYINGLTTIDFGNGVEIIGNSAFRFCEGISKLTLPNNIKKIGINAFYGTSLTKITLGNKVKHIGSGAFESCYNLTEVNLPDSLEYIGDYVFSSCFNLSSNAYDKGNYLGNQDNPYLLLLEVRETSTSSINIHENTKFINTAAFSGCKYLTSVTIPKNVQFIGKSAFYGCDSLNKVIVDEANQVYKAPNKTAIIRKEDNCLTHGLNNTIIPKGVRSIGDFAFSNCDQMTSIEIPDGVTSIGISAFRYCMKLETVVLPESIISIGQYAFADCYQLTKINLSNNLTYLSEGTFNRCKALVNIVIPDSVTSIGAYAFANTIIEDINFGNSLVYIGESAFQRCTELTKLVISDNVRSIGLGAFYGCEGLTSISIGSGLAKIGTQTFTDCYNITKVTVDANNKALDSRDNCNAIIETGTNTLLVGVKTTVIPASVKIIGTLSFYECPDLSVLDLSNITRIDSYAFYGTAITKVTLGKDLESIGAGAFNGCKELSIIIIPKSVNTIGNNAFRGCDQLKIYAEATDKPSDWASNWNRSNRPVFWYSDTSNTDGNHWHYVNGMPTVWGQ